MHNKSYPVEGWSGGSFVWWTGTIGLAGPIPGTKIDHIRVPEDFSGELPEWCEWASCNNCGYCDKYGLCKADGAVGNPCPSWKPGRRTDTPKQDDTKPEFKVGDWVVVLESQQLMFGDMDESVGKLARISVVRDKNNLIVNDWSWNASSLRHATDEELLKHLVEERRKGEYRTHCGSCARMPSRGSCAHNGINGVDQCHWGNMKHFWPNEAEAQKMLNAARS